jgi:curved DNA-binding protein CbpA
VTDERDPYAILGVPRGATDRAIREAYYAKARSAHPDLVGEVGLDAMRALNTAWALLKDPERRATYDADHGLTTRPADGAADGRGATAHPPTGGPAHATGPATARGGPAWTGAAGAPPGKPWGPVLDFGIYAGWSLGEIARRDRGYLYWLRDRREAKTIRKELDFLLESEAAQEQAKAKARRGR